MVIARSHRITGEDLWYGYRRTKFDFDGRTAWIVEPSVAPLAGCPWTWTMQIPRFKAAGGEIEVAKRGAFGHHPHGLDPDKTRPIVDFFTRRSAADAN